MLRRYVIYEYKSIYPELSGTELTDSMIRRCLKREDAVIVRTDKGKPYIRFTVSDSGGPFISVSHSGGTFALAVSGVEVGLDIQYARDINQKRISARFFSPEEAESVAADDTGDRFFELWTRKEAYSKFTGDGIAQVVKNEPAAAGNVRFTELRLEDGCFCAVCTEKEEGDQTDEIQISYGE